MITALMIITGVLLCIAVIVTSRPSWPPC